LKTPTSDLFALIKSMTKAEKKYFRQNAQRYSHKNTQLYLQLFDAISQQKVYNEAALKADFISLGLATHFAVTKKYLYEQILTTLHQLHESKSITAKVKRDLHICQVLLEKKLDAQVKKRLSKIRKNIERYELFYLEPELLLLERRYQERKKSGSSSLENWQEAWQNNIAHLQEVFHHNYLYGKVAELHYRKVRLSQEDLPKILHPLLNSQRYPECTAAKVNFLRAQATLNFMLGKSEAAYQSNQHLLQLLDDQPDFQALHPDLYIGILNNFLIDNLQLKKYEELQTGLIRLKSLPQQKSFRNLPRIEERVFELSTLLELNMYVGNQDFDLVLPQLPKLEQQLANFGNRIALHYRLTFHYLIAYIYFENQAYARAYDALSPLLQRSQQGIVEELLRFSRLLNLIIQFELGHYELLDALIISVRRQNSRQGKLYETEKLLFRLLRQLINQSSKKEQKKLLQNYLPQFEQLSQEQAETRVLNYFNPIHWIIKNI
jgi:hypothetical protein